MHHVLDECGWAGQPGGSGDVVLGGTESKGSLGHLDTFGGCD